MLNLTFIFLMELIRDSTCITRDTMMVDLNGGPMDKMGLKTRNANVAIKKKRYN